MKQCRGCGEWKDESDFYKCDGYLQASCKKCYIKSVVERNRHRMQTDPLYRKQHNECQRNRLRRINNTKNPRGEYTGAVCTIIHKHHDDMKDDPEHLTTEFLQELLGRKCKDTKTTVQEEGVGGILTEMPTKKMRANIIVADLQKVFPLEYAMIRDLQKRDVEIEKQKYLSNFLDCIRLMECEVVCTRNLDQSIWWMISTHNYIGQDHYPKQKKGHTHEACAVGALCCINNFGQVSAKKILKEHSIAELICMDEKGLRESMNTNQYTNFTKTTMAKGEVKGIEK